MGVLSRLLPSDRWPRLLLAPALVLVATGIDRNYQTDLWHHLARGRAVWEEGRLLDEDRFTYTIPGQPFRDCNWVWQAGAYGLHELGGLSLLQVVNSVVLGTAMAVLVGLCGVRGRSAALAAALGVFVFVGLWQLLLIRPQTLSILLFVTLYAVLEAGRHRPRLLWLAPLILAVWVNVHGGFPVGLALVGAFALGTGVEAVGRVGLGQVWRDPACRRLFACLLGCLAATLVNPYGWRVYEYVALTSGRAAGRRIDEWLPPGSDTLVGKVWIASLVLVLVAFALPARRPAAREVCLLGVFLVAACGSVRMVAWWLLVSAPVLAAQFGPLLPRAWIDQPDARKPSAGAALLCAALLLACAISTPWLEPINPVMALPGRGHRVESDLEAVARHLDPDGRHEGRIFCSLEWAEYLGWRLSPRFRVFMDGRIEIFPDSVWANYTALTRGRADWEEMLAAHDVDSLVLDTAGYHGELLPHVARSPRWKQVGQFGRAVVYRKACDGDVAEPNSR